MELELIEHLRQRLKPHPLLRLGIGDDAAVLDLRATELGIVTVDMLMDGVDFRLGEIEPRRAGHKALAVNLSDLAAMAAEPLAAVVALALPRHRGMELAIGIYGGILPLAEEFGVAIAGGDTNSWDGPLAISITALGRATSHGPLTRNGARAGDAIVVTGEFGGSILGHHLDFTPRVREALYLAERYQLHAAIDVSDGLSRDLAHLASESRLGAVIDLARVPVSAAAHQLAQSLADGSTPLDHALADGEDFELIMAVPPPEAARMIADPPPDLPLAVIGQFIEAPGLWQRDGEGNVVPLAPRGFQHQFD